MPATTAADGSQIAFAVDGSGPALLLLPGQGTDRHWWDRVLPDLARHHTVVRPDYLGTGGSAPAEHAGFSTRRFAADAVAALDAAGIDRFHAYGISMGGKVAQWVALEHPDRVDRLVLGCTSPGGAAAVTMDRATAAAFGKPGEAGRRALLELMYTPAWLADHEPNPAVVAAPATPRARMGHRKASRQHDTSGLLGTLHAPTLVLHGTDDALIPPANADLLARLLPNARVHGFEGARHAYFEECPEATDLALDFLGAS